MDENDKLKAGILPPTPDADAEVVAEGPRVVWADDGLRRAAQRAITPQDLRYISTGHRELDELTGGMRPKEAWLLGADTSWGKSSWIVSVCDEAMKKGHRPLIITMEDPEEVWFDRLLARRAGVNAKRLRNRSLTSDEMTAVDRVQRAAPKKPLVLEAFGKSAEWIMKTSKEIIKTHECDLVFVDYLQEVGTDDKDMRKDPYREQSWIARNFRALYKDLGVAFCLVTQLTLDKEGERPSKRSVRGSKDIIIGTEVCVMGWNPIEDVQTRNRGVIEAGTRLMLLVKAKSMETDFVVMNWDKHSACFRQPPNGCEEHYQGFEEL